jgi:hypothetical protein
MPRTCASSAIPSCGWRWAITSIGTGGFFAWLSYIAPLLTDVSRFAPGRDSDDHDRGRGRHDGWRAVAGGKLADRVHPLRAITILLASMIALLCLNGCWRLRSRRWWCWPSWSGANALALGPSIQMLLIEHSREAEMLGSSLGQSGFNIGNATGAFLGGIPLIMGYSYAAPQWVAAGLAVMRPGAVAGLQAHGRRGAPGLILSFRPAAVRPSNRSARPPRDDRLQRPRPPGSRARCRHAPAAQRPLAQRRGTLGILVRQQQGVEQRARRHVEPGCRRNSPMASATGSGTASFGAHFAPTTSSHSSPQRSYRRRAGPGIRRRARAGKSRRPRGRCRRTGRVGIDAGDAARQHLGQRGHMHRVLPQLLGLGAQAGILDAAAELAHHQAGHQHPAGAVADPRDGRAHVGDRAVAAAALKAAELASATVRAASCGSASTRRIASSSGQSGSSSACCRRSTALTLVGKDMSPRAAWATMYPKASSLFTRKLYRPTLAHRQFPYCSSQPVVSDKKNARSYKKPARGP